MNNLFKNIKTKVGITISSFLSVLGAGGGSASAVCQTTCSTGSALPFFLGFTLSATPLAFIEDYQLTLWWISFIVFGLLALLFILKIIYSKIDRAFLFLNGGLLLIGTPYFREQVTFLPWIGLFILIYGFYLLLSARRIVIKFV